MYAMYKKFDRNGDGKITAEDIQIYLQELGVGGVSPCVYLLAEEWSFSEGFCLFSVLAKALFKAVDQNKNGTLDFTDLMALTTLLNKLYGGAGGVAE